MEEKGPNPQELGLEIGKGIEKIKEEPANEQMLDKTPSPQDIKIDNDQSGADREKAHIQEMLAKYPENQRRVMDSQDGIDCIYLGNGEISPKLSHSIENAKAVLRAKFGDRLSEVFKDLKVYYVRNELGGRGGFAYSGANAIIMDTDNNQLTVAEAEEFLGPNGEIKLLEPGDWQKVVEDREGSQTISGETTLVHEIGHIFQAKTNTKFQDTENAPTKYGRTKEWEDYAESFLYYCYDKPLAGDRSALIAQDISMSINSEVKNQPSARETVDAFDTVLKQLPPENLIQLRRWKDVGAFCAVLIGAKPTMLVNPESTKFLLDQLKRADPAVANTFDTIPINPSNEITANKQAVVNVFNQNPEYFPRVTDYTEARSFLAQTFNPNVLIEDPNSEEAIKNQVMVGLVLGYPKGDVEQFARLGAKVSQQLLQKINTYDYQKAYTEMGLSKEELDLLRQFKNLSNGNSKDINLTDQLKAANQLEPKIQEILEKTAGVDEDVKEFFLKKRVVSANDISWVGSVNSPDRADFVRKLDDQFRLSGMRDILTKHDIVLQGHSNSLYSSEKIAD